MWPVLSVQFCQPWWWRRYVLQKRWYQPTRPHGVTIHKTTIDIFSAVRSSHFHTVNVFYPQRFFRNKYEARDIICNPWPSDYEAGVLTSQPWWKVPWENTFRLCKLNYTTSGKGRLLGLLMESRKVFVHLRFVTTKYAGHCPLSEILGFEPVSTFVSHSLLRGIVIKRWQTTATYAMKIQGHLF